MGCPIFPQILHLPIHFPRDPHCLDRAGTSRGSSALRRLAQSRAGVLSREQVLGLGLSSRVIERLIASDRWRPLARGIYLTVPSDPSWDALAWGRSWQEAPRLGLDRDLGASSSIDRGESGPGRCACSRSKRCPAGGTLAVPT